ncbi:MAG TPA: ATP-binding protein, partial [Rhodothermales bacterium]|nr:ATP-binding protein [Rhodothermales bacterium]
TSVPAREADPTHRARLLAGLRASDRVKESVKRKPDAELLAHYDLIAGGRLTNLGVLWLGRREHRARLLHAPIIQYIRYDVQRRKVAKELFGDDYTMTPWDQIEAVQQLGAWQERVEVPNGLFRENVAIYDVELIRELVANALVHRVYTTRGDIFLNHFAESLEVHSPGPLPAGVTPRNILHARKRRNEALARLFHDLKLMEGEGTGYDRMYDLLLSSGRPAPEVREGPDRVEVIIRGGDLDRRALQVIATASQHGPLEERERITLGLLARNGPMTRAALASALSLSAAREVGSWTETLIERGLVVVVGQAAGQRLKVNPRLLREAGAPVRTTLIDIENHRLRELVRTDVVQFPGARIADIIERIGREIPRRRIQRQLAQLREDGVVTMAGGRGTARYYPARERT